MDGFDCTGLVLGLLALSSFGTRLLAWFLANRRYLLIVADLIERLAGGRGPGSLKGEIGLRTGAAGGAVEAIAEAVAARAEKRGGVSGKASERRKKSKRPRAVRELGRWLPVLGAFL